MESGQLGCDEACCGGTVKEECCANVDILEDIVAHLQHALIAGQGDLLQLPPFPPQLQGLLDCHYPVVLGAMEEGVMSTPTVWLWTISDYGSASAPFMLPRQALSTSITFEHSFFTLCQGHALELGAS